MAGDPLDRRIAAQRKAVEAARARHVFELLVLRRLEARAGESRRSSLTGLLERAEARRRDMMKRPEDRGPEAFEGGEDREG
jgi:hypothetical protein